MELTKEYLDEQEDCIKRNYDVHISWGNNPHIRERYMFLREFCRSYKTILDVGSGGVEPLAIGATHALDVHLVARDFLKQNGWKGQFFIGSCDDLPFNEDAFDVAVCSEVIEHLPNLEIVKNTFWELDRVAKRWIVTTPNIDVKEKTHKFLFTKEDLLKLTKDLDVRIIKKGIFWYVIKN